LWKEDSVPQLKDFIQLQTTSGDPQTIGDATITPQSQALIVRFPFGGFVWNRPVAVLVDRNGQTERIPIVDATRIAQLGIFGLALAFSIMIAAFAARRRSK
jgi:hypothetical protein